MRSLTPFLISLLLGALLACSSPRAEAQPAPAAAPTASIDARAQILDQLARQLVSYFQVDGTLTLEPQRQWVPPAASGPLEVSIAEYPKELSSSLLVRFRVVANGELITEPTLVFRAQLLRDVLVTRTPLEREALFDRNTLDSRLVDVLRERDPVLVTSEVKDMIFARAVTAGRIVSWSDLVRRPLVRRGEMIEVAATDGTMVIVLRGQALDNGSAGDVVRVRNMESRKDFNAFVVANNRAEVRF